MSTVGYGDITPTTRAEIVLDLLLMVVGTSVYGYAIASIAQLVTNGTDSIQSRANAQLKEITAYLVSAVLV